MKRVILKRMILKSTICRSLLAALALCLAGAHLSALAENAWRTEENLFAKAARADFRTLGLPKKTSLPVYAAPGEDSFRGAKGKASVSLSEPFRILGETKDHVWQMIEYDVSKGACRVGWIRLPDGAEKPQLREISADAALARTTGDVKLTDDPRGSGRALCSLPAGRTVAVLFDAGSGGKPLLYVKTEIDGKKAAGFLPGGLCEPLPMYEIRGETLVVADGVEQLGGDSGWWDYGSDGTDEPVWRGEDSASVFGRVCLSMDIDEGMDEETGLSPLAETTKVVLPDTLRGIGTPALFGIHADELAIPEGVTRLDIPDTFYSSTIGTLRFPSTLTDLVVLQAFTYTPVARFTVAEGNPAYSSRDGVLFSRDGKTLVAYPSGAAAQHYDVPAGTEVIGAHAFRDDMGALPLVTISLPMGLREIGKRAFADCGNLISLAVPPTVKRMEKDAFAYCVALQRLSLPAGLTADLDGEWVIRDDFSAYNGDNGPTLPAPRQTEEDEDDME